MYRHIPDSTRARQRGFTLIEIMVAVLVVAIMGAIIGPTVFRKVQQAEETRIAQDIRAIDSALKFYRLDNFRFPTTAQGLEALMSAPNGADNWNGPYLEELPQDPYGNTYLYTNPGTHGREVDIYTLGADGVEGGEGSDQDWGNWNISS